MGWVYQGLREGKDGFIEDGYKERGEKWVTETSRRVKSVQLKPGGILYNILTIGYSQRMRLQRGLLVLTLFCLFVCLFISNKRQNG